MGVRFKGGRSHPRSKQSTCKQADEIVAMIEQASKNGESSLLFARLRAGERQPVAIKLN
jgi:hypothetical protein